MPRLHSLAALLGLALAALADAALDPQEADPSTALCVGVADASCHEEDLDSLEFSLLQTGLSRKHEPSEQRAAEELLQQSFGAQAHGGLPPPAARGAPASSVSQLSAAPAVPQLAAAAAPSGPRPALVNVSYSPRQSSLVAMLNAWERFDTGASPHLAGGVPMILLFMVAFLIGAVFVIQVISIATETKESEAPVAASLTGLPLHRRRQDPRYNAAVPTSSLLRPGTDQGPPPRESFASQGSPFSQLYPPQAMPPMPSPQTHRDEAGMFPRPSGGLEFYPSGGFPGSGGSLETSFSRTQRTDASLEAARLPDAICPALILPHAEAQFCLTLESLRRLSAGKCPVQILGPSRKPLLHARLPPSPPGAASTAPGGGAGSCWLELSTTATTKYPHACVGPLRLAGAETGGGTGGRPQSLEIRGPRGDNYGTLEQSGSGWRAMHQGRMVLFVNIAPQGNALSATSVGGSVVATASLVPAVDADQSRRQLEAGGSARPSTSEADGPALKLQVQPGVDALLYLLCMLAVVLVAPELAALRSGEGVGRFSGAGGGGTPSGSGRLW